MSEDNPFDLGPSTKTKEQVQKEASQAGDVYRERVNKKKNKSLEEETKKIQEQGSQ